MIEVNSIVNEVIVLMSSLCDQQQKDTVIYDTTDAVDLDQRPKLKLWQERGERGKQDEKPVEEKSKTH